MHDYISILIVKYKFPVMIVGRIALSFDSYYPIAGNSALNSETNKNIFSAGNSINILVRGEVPAQQVRQPPVCKVSGAFPDILQLSQHQLIDQFQIC